MEAADAEAEPSSGDKMLMKEGGGDGFTGL